jgi:hypothetical protein
MSCVVVTSDRVTIEELELSDEAEFLAAVAAATGRSPAHRVED